MGVPSDNQRSSNSFQGSLRAYVLERIWSLLGVGTEREDIVLLHGHVQLLQM